MSPHGMATHLDYARPFPYMPSKSISKIRLRLRDGILIGKKAMTRPSVETPSDNVFHCCLHKSGSQWIRRILKDARIYKYSGLEAYHYQSSLLDGHDPRPVNSRRFDEPFPLRKIVTPLYIDYPGYIAIPKPASSRAFFVTRDPRDIVVSWYFSSKFSHRLMGDLADVRGNLSDLDQVSGLQYSIRHLSSFGLFASQRSWLDSIGDATTTVIRFEDLIGPEGRDHFIGLFEHCLIEIPDRVLDAVLATYNFERLSGRPKGQEDTHAHFRKGISGDWRNYFVPEVQNVFDEVVGDLVVQLGYYLA